MKLHSATVSLLASAGRIVVALAAGLALLSAFGVASRLFSEGTESVGDGYSTFDNGTEIRLLHRDADGSMNVAIDADVKALERRTGFLIVARWPMKAVMVDGHLDSVHEGGGCQYWRIDTRTHATVRITRGEAGIDC